MKLNQLSDFRKWQGRAVVTFATVLMTALLAGCGPKPYVDENRTTISGVVTFAGEPLKGGTLSFYSKDKGIGTSASISSEGRYATNRVPIGENIVTIDTEELQYGSPRMYTKIPARYADPSRSGLSVDVKKGTNENVDFELKK